MLTLLNASTLAALMILLAIGLALIFGLRHVMNFAHGSLYMIGAYVGYTVIQHSSFWVALVVVPLALAILGAALELVIFRPLRNRSELEVALVTYGLSLIAGQLVLKIFGGRTRPVTAPAALGGSVNVFGVEYPTYRLFLIGVGLVTCLLVYCWLRYTRTGLFVRAVSNDPDTAQIVGVNSRRVGLYVVVASAAFAGLAGVLAGPYLSVDPGMGDAIMITALIIVAVGGLGSIGGAIVAALLFGLVTSLGREYAPSVSALTPYVLLIVVLALRPEGIGRRRTT